MRCQALCGEHYVLKVPHSGCLHLSGFTGGNAIFGITIYEARACPFELFAVFAELAIRGVPCGPELLRKQFNEFAKTQGFLFQVCTSDGCDLLTLCKRSPRGIEISMEPG
jgi:hypothetical protein